MTTFLDSLQRYLPWGKERRQRTLELGQCWRSWKVSKWTNLQHNKDNLYTLDKQKHISIVTMSLLWSELEVTTDAPVKSEEPQMAVEEETRWVTFVTWYSGRFISKEWRLAKLVTNQTENFIYKSCRLCTSHFQLPAPHLFAASFKACYFIWAIDIYFCGYICYLWWSGCRSVQKWV